MGSILRFLEIGKGKGGELFRGLLEWEGTRRRVVTLTADDDDESDDGDEKKS